MDRTTKFLIPFSLLIIGVGLYLVFVGLNPKQVVNHSTNNEFRPTPSPFNLESTSSAEPINAPVNGVAGEKVTITKVVDGDTVKISTGQTVRLLGIDTPETVDPRKPVQCFGKEASNKTKELLTGKEVILQKDVSETDKYQRLLRFIYLPLPDGNILFVNDYLVREGYAKPLTIPPDVKYADQFLEASRVAREQKKGLWGKC